MFSVRCWIAYSALCVTLALCWQCTVCDACTVLTVNVDAWLASTAAEIITSQHQEDVRSDHSSSSVSLRTDPSEGRVSTPPPSPPHSLSVLTHQREGWAIPSPPPTPSPYWPIRGTGEQSSLHLPATPSPSPSPLTRQRDGWAILPPTPSPPYSLSPLLPLPPHRPVRGKGEHTPSPLPHPRAPSYIMWNGNALKIKNLL